MTVVEEIDENNGLIIPDEFLCPLTLEIMQQPVMTRWGHNFERDVLMKWMQYNSHCPMTRNPISLKDVIVNRALKAKILHWQQEQRQLGVLHRHHHNNKATTTSSSLSATTTITKSNDVWLMTMMDHVDLVDNDNSDRNDQILPFLVNVDSPQVLMRALKRSSDPCGKHALQYLLQQQQQQQDQKEPQQRRQHHDARQQQNRSRRRMQQRQCAAFAS